MDRELSLTGVERSFDPGDVIVSKTDLKGRMTYVNRTFLNVAGYTERECLGQPHSLIRHPDMPRCVFKLLWDTIQDRREIFAYVINRCKNGDHYWVFAHVTPSFDTAGKVIGYHSNRRVPHSGLVASVIVPLYAKLLDEERKYSNAKQGMLASFDMLVTLLKQQGVDYDEFILTATHQARAA